MPPAARQIKDFVDVISIPPVFGTSPFYGRLRTHDCFFSVVYGYIVFIYVIRKKESTPFHPVCTRARRSLSPRATG